MRLRVLLACVVLPLLLWAVLPVGSPATSLTNVQKKIQSTQGRIGRKKGTERLLTTQISAYNRRIEALQGKITTLGSREARLQADLDRKRALLTQTQTALRSERGRLVRLRARLLVARRTLAHRLVELYQSDRPDIVSVVMNAKGFADLLEREEFISRISDQDRQVITLVRTAKQDATSTSQRLDALERRQRQVASVVLARRNQLAAVKGQLVDTRVGYQGTRADKARALGTVRTSRHALEGKLDDLKAEQAKIEAALRGPGVGSLPAGPIRAGSGQLIWPVNGPITSPFCETRAWEACHPGIDIGVPSGTPIRAAAAGTVALTQSEAASGGYGNFTCIAHTATMSTCYAHQSSIGVSVGQHVTQGQVIGISGCTGRCYGAHLHFEVRINGAVTNPLNYL
jgi:murein DD-endopeptidase MepM/ murein hydrolase activator NlpD